MEGLPTLIIVAMAFGLLSAFSKLLLPWLKGKHGEKLVARELEGLSSHRYTLFHDVTLPTGNGTTQIDHLVLSTHGVFVIETKNISGWIFGSERQASWTQSFPKGKVSFQNPLRQNFLHVKVLQELLGLEQGALFSIVVFVGNAEFKTSMPENVVKLSGLVPFISRKASDLIAAHEIQRLVGVIEANRRSPGAETDAAHLQGLAQRHGQAAGVLDGIVGTARDVRTLVLWVKGGLVVLVVALVLIAGTFIIGNVTSVFHRQPATAMPSAVSLPAPGSVQTQGSGARTAVDSEREAWEASLFCGYSEDAQRCVCYEPKGPKADIEYERCVILAKRGPARHP